VLAGGIEAPDETLREQHRARRGTLSWLPDTLEEAAALCLLTVAEETAPGPRIVAYGRGHDPHGEWSLTDTLRRLEVPEIESVVVSDPIPPEILDGWNREVGDRVLVQSVSGSRAFGAAGAPLALSSLAQEFDGSALLIGRGFEGAAVAIVMSR
jgi:hypothetical protein